MSPSNPVAFSPEEWAALFPARVPDDAGLGTASADGLPSPSFPHASLSANALVEELQSSSPLLAGFVRVELLLLPLAPSSVLRAAADFVARMALLPLLWVFNGRDPQFTQRGLAAGTAAVVVAALGPLFVPLWASYRSTFARPSPSAGQDMSSHAYAVVARWLQLARTAELPDGLGAAESPLVSHDSKDPLCPCSRPECAGNLPRAAGIYRFVESTWRILLTAFLVVISWNWTLLVTFASQTFATPYGIVLVVLALAAYLAYHPTQVLLRSPANLATLQLSLRLQRRGMSLALSSFLSRYRSALFGPSPPVAGFPGAAREAYVELEAAFTAVWRRRLPFLSFGATMIMSMIPTTLLAILIEIAAGSCVPAYLLGILVLVLSMLTTDVVNTAASNEQITDIAELFAEARTAVRRMIARAETDPSSLAPSPGGAELLVGLRAHEALLASFAEDAPRRYRGKLLGFAVDAGVARTMAVTLVTVVVTLWSILRASGVYVTLQTVCPTA